MALIKTEGSVGLGVLSNSWKAETVVMKNDASGMWFSPYPVYIRSDKKVQNWTWSMMLRVVCFLNREIDILVQSCSGFFNRLSLCVSLNAIVAFILSFVVLIFGRMVLLVLTSDLLCLVCTKSVSSNCYSSAAGL